MTEKNHITAVLLQEWLSTIKYQSLGSRLIDIELAKSEHSITLIFSFFNSTKLNFSNCDSASFYWELNETCSSFYSESYYKEQFGQEFSMTHNENLISEIKSKLSQVKVIFTQIKSDKDEIVHLKFNVRNKHASSNLDVRIFSSVFADFITPDLLVVEGT